MSIRAAVYDLLNDIESDVFPVFARQETTDPYVVYNMRVEPVLTQDYTLVADMPELYDVDLTLEIYASTFADCVTLADAIFAGMNNAAGIYGGQTLKLCRWVSESDDYIADVNKVNITQEYNLKFE
jgi:hypothetical protein